MQDEWNCLIRGPPGLSAGDPPTSGPAWLQPTQWSQLLLLGSAVPAMEGIALSMASAADEAAWQAWASSSNPHTHPLPAAWEPQVNSFQRMLLLKVSCCYFYVHKSSQQLHYVYWGPQTGVAQQGSQLVDMNLHCSLVD